MRKRGLLVTAFAAIAIIVAWAGFPLTTAHQPAAVAPISQLVGGTMGGDWSVRFAKPLDAARADALRAEIQAILDRVDGQMSTWNPKSDLSRFNAHRDADWVLVPADLATVVAEARRISEQTRGAFDVTVGPLVNLWGFGPSPNGPATRAADRVPPDDAIAAAMAHVGFRKLDIRATPPALRKSDPELYVDLSAIAQGYAADLVAARLDAAGVADHLVDVCGEIRATGVNSNGEPWRVGIQAPVPDTRRPFRGVRLSNLALATSGDYVNFFEHAGRRYSHEIDPRTGRPIAHRLASVSVVHASAATADALATALMVLGPEEGLAHAKRHGLAALFVVRNDARDGFQTIITPDFEAALMTPTVSSRWSDSD